jgi:hypothetical protein
MTFTDYILILTDSKHTSAETNRFLIRSNIKLLKAPVASPDLNPIELIWNDMKYFLNNTYKPNNKIQLVAGIKHYWENILNHSSIDSKINQIHKVLRKVILLKEKATGYLKISLK